MGADQPKLVAAIDQRQAQRAAHHAGTQDSDSRHQLLLDAAGWGLSLLVEVGAALAGGLGSVGRLVGKPRFGSVGSSVGSAVGNAVGSARAVTEWYSEPCRFADKFLTFCH